MAERYGAGRRTAGFGRRERAGAVLILLAGCSGALSPGTAAQPTLPPPGEAASPAGPVLQLRAEEIRAVLAGNTATGRTAEGRTYYAYFNSDGRVAFREGELQDTGTWRVSPDGRLCSRMVRLGGPIEQCFAITRQGSLFMFRQRDGKTAGSFTVLSGDPLQF